MFLLFFPICEPILKIKPTLQGTFSVCESGFLMSQTIGEKQNRNVLNKGIFFVIIITKYFEFDSVSTV